MGLDVIRFSMCLLIGSQSIQLVLACECESCGCYDCGGQTCYSDCEQCFVYPVEEIETCSVCECNDPLADISHSQAGSNQTPPETKSPTFVGPAAEPKSALPTAATETPTPAIPAAPIAVPEPDNEVAPPTGDLFPGPEAPVDKSATEPAPEENPQIDELFEEPSAITEPQPLPPSDSTAPQPNSTDALFVEPKQNSEEPTAEEPTENVSPPETEKETDTFDDLFGPSDEEPKKKEESSPEPFDPFSRGGFPSSMPAASSLASPESRVWSDDTRQFTCQARLLSVTAKHVILDKGAGEHVAVPLSKLCNIDLVFVHDHICAIRTLQARKSLAAQFAVSWSH